MEFTAHRPDVLRESSQRKIKGKSLRSPWPVGQDGQRAQPLEIAVSSEHLPISFHSNCHLSQR